MTDKHITVLVDNKSWIVPYAQRLVHVLTEQGYDAEFVQCAEAVSSGWINFMLGCTRIVGKHVLERNRHNLVVHESDLPQGRGFAPMTWQILEDKRSIPVCLLEAAAEADAGSIWLRDSIELDGSELCSEWRALQGEKTLEMCLRFVHDYAALTPVKQVGVSSYYERRRPADSRLDPDKCLREQLSQLRVADNERYPAYFEIDGQCYILHVYKADYTGSE
ncbi:MAG: formyltransferase family protein [Pseudomonadota bacterium]